MTVNNKEANKETNKEPAAILELIQRNEIKFVDFKFTTPMGRCLHISYHRDAVDHKTFIHGLPFDSSSIEGWKSIERSDMVLMPDLSTAFLDPFTSQPTLVILCDIIDIETNKDYDRDPRSTAKRALRYLKESKIADQAYFGPEMEFFIFDDVRYDVKENGSFFEIDSTEGSYNSGRKYEYNNHGHRFERKNCYLSAQPIDSFNDIRAEILETFKEIKMKPTLHHHEVASSQCEVGFEYSDIITAADNIQKGKYVVHNVASSYGKSATFMPKPVKEDNGSGMHVHQSLWLKGKNLFASPDGNASSLSQICLYYIGGIIKHGKALSAFTNPTTNSYKRLIPGYEAPNALAYSFFNRSAAIRIPYASGLSPAAARIEARFPDASANPYYAVSAMLMAGLDGIINKVNPAEAVNKNLFKEKVPGIEYIPSSLKEALEILDKEREFLLQGGVFTNSQVDSYIEMKMKEQDEVSKYPTPIEFKKYYSS